MSAASRRDEELAREIRTHLELEAEEQMAVGVSAAEARRRARVVFGGIAQTREQVRAVWVPRWWDEIQRDLRFAVRTLFKHPVFAVTTILTLALGIGANTAIFSLMDQVLLRSLPVADAGDLVMLDGPGVFQGFTSREDSFSVPMFRRLHAESAPVLDGLLARFSVAVTAAVRGAPERLTAEVVSGDYFTVLRQTPVTGRLLAPGDDRIVDGHPVIVLGDRYWTRRFARDPAVIGESMAINGLPMTVVGVTTFPGIELSAPADIFVPLMMKRTLTPTRDDLDSWRARWVTLAGRLRPGITIEQVAARLQSVYAQALTTDAETAHLDADERAPFLAKKLEVRPGGRGLSDLRDQFSTALFVLMGMVGLVLLIACANVANLLLARAAGQERETAIRLALGAGRARVIRQRTVETLVLAVLGAIAGLAVASWTTRLLIGILPYQGASLLTASPDLRLGAFAVVIAIASALVAGAWPAWHAAMSSNHRVLKEETARVSSSRRQSVFRKVVAVAQVALSIILLAGAVMFARTLDTLRNAPTGFVTENLLQFRIDLSSAGYVDERARAAVAGIEAALREMPGVAAVSSATTAVLNGSRSRQTIRVAGYVPARGEDMNPTVNTVGSGYFAALGTRLVSGREFTEADGPKAPKVAIINETMAHYYWKDQNPLGRRFGRPADGNDFEFEVVGVAPDTKFTTLRDGPQRSFVVPYMQAERLASMVFYVRHRADLDPVATASRAAVRRFDPGLPVYDMRSFSGQVDRVLFLERLLAGLSLAFAAVATCLAAVGLYGLMSFTVARRTREIGIRIALGSSRRQVLGMVLGEVALILGAGVAIGVPAVLATGRFVEAQLFGVTATDAFTLGVAVAFLSSVGFLAGYLPAYRASRLSPVLALRYE